MISSRVAVIGHRGASFWAPEETAPAFLLARELGADWLEMDIQRTKDGVLIAHHDGDLARTTDCATVFPGRERDGVHTFTWDEVRRLDAGSWFNAKQRDRARESFRGLVIQRLEDVIGIGEKGAPAQGLYIETKLASRFPGIEEELVGLLRNRGWFGRTHFQSFEPDSLERLRELAPGVPSTYLIRASMVRQQGWRRLLHDACRIATVIGPDLGCMVRRHWVVGEAHRLGLEVHPWTVDPKWMMRLALGLGADGLFTNRCDVMLKHVGRPGPAVDSLWERIGYKR
ncbi:MAG: glycerophosphodiester phosphodiesterase family protein [Candidatus Coatesbacteria bacterium]